MKNKPVPKYNKGQTVNVYNKSCKIARCVYNREYQEYEYYIYPQIAPVFEHEINKTLTAFETV